jgi:hypothetical protein
MKAYSAVLQTIIAIALCAIVAKLYLPSANAIGVHIGAPTRGDMLSVAKAPAGDQRKNLMKSLLDRIPLTAVEGDVSISEPIEVTGSVQVSGEVEVSGEVSIDGPVQLER